MPIKINCRIIDSKSRLLTKYSYNIGKRYMAFFAHQVRIQRWYKYYVKNVYP